MLDPKSVELIDTCRPDGRDVQSPELAALLAADPEARAVCERVQQLDARFASAMHEVAVPGDLAGGVLELSIDGVQDREPVVFQIIPRGQG